MAYAPTQKPTMIKSASAADSQSLRAPIMHRHRKSVSTGGGRAWSDAEEAYLIETREHKMPYKHIASQLKKTELACRLHYHQLSFGNKGRRHPQHPTHRNERSSAPPAAHRSRAGTPQQPLPSFSPPASPPETMDYSPSEASSLQTPQAPIKPLLPKPNLPSTATTTPASIPHHHRRSHTANSEPPSPLRLVTEDVDLLHQKRHQTIDLEKLDLIYESHRLHFWSTIAHSYGRDLSPATLEEAWCRAHCSSGRFTSSKFPPTPRGSPQAPFSAPVAVDSSSSLLSSSGNKKGGGGGGGGEGGSGFTPINNNSNSSDPSSKPTAAPRQTSSFAISSLLTEDREFKSPAREKKPSEDVGTSVKDER